MLRRDPDQVTTDRSAAGGPVPAGQRPLARGKTPRRPRGHKLTGPDTGQYLPSIALRSVDGHLTRTADTVYAWYRLSPQRWAFKGDGERRRLIEAVAGQYGELQGRWLHLRVTTRPFPIRDWAVSHVRNSHDRLPDVPGAQSFDDYMLDEQRQLRGRSMAEKEVYLGVEVQTRRLVDRAVERAAPLLERIFPDAVDAELVALDSEVAHLDQVVGSYGLEGRPATEQEMRWLLERSAALGLPAPGSEPAAGDGHWATEDLAAIDELASYYAEPYAPTLTVRGRAGFMANQTRYVCVLTVGLMQDLQIPEQDDPWVQHGDRLPTPLEWSARIYVRRPEEVSGELRRQRGKVSSQVRHYTVEHELDPPMALARQADLAVRIDDDMSSGFNAQLTRVQSWWRVAVSGATQAEALRHAQQLLEMYKPKVALEHPEAQYALAREFIPGEPLASKAYMRRGPVRWAASAMPTATADVGDRRGVLLGETCTSTRRPVAWDPWMAQEIRDQSGLTALVAGLGGGKSYLGGGLVYKTLRSGAHWTILDPSGPLAALCEMPELRPFARHIDLMHSAPGILNPYRVVPNPHREDYVNNEEDFIRDMNEASASRRRLVLDVLKGLLPYELAHKAESQIVLLRAVRAVGGREDAHPGLVIDKLMEDRTDLAEHARAVHESLDEMRDRMTLLIPQEGRDPYARSRDDRLTVLTMAGLVLPKDGVGREHWTDQEALGMELLNLAAWLTQRMVYEGPSDYERRTGGRRWKNARKGVWIDEAFFLSEVPTGRVLMNRFARDSRKWNTRVLLSSQVPSDFLKIEGFISLVDSVFVGRLDDDDVQSDALRLLKVPVDAGYEQVIGQLGRRPGGNRGTERDRSPRQFIFGDGNGGVERIRIDFSGPHLEQLRTALDTTPGDEGGVYEPLPTGETDPAANGSTQAVTAQAASAAHTHAGDTNFDAVAGDAHEDLALYAQRLDSTLGLHAVPTRPATSDASATTTGEGAA